MENQIVIYMLELMFKHIGLFIIKGSYDIHPHIVLGYIILILAVVYSIFTILLKVRIQHGCKEGLGMYHVCIIKFFAAVKPANNSLC